MGGLQAERCSTEIKSDNSTHHNHHRPRTVSYHATSTWYRNEHWDAFEPVPYSAHVAMGTFMIPVTILALIGNGLVIWVFMRFQSLRTPANLLVINLSLSDFLMAGLGYPMFITASFKGGWSFGKEACQFYGVTGAWFALMSINSMAAIAVDRYLIITKGYKVTYKQCYVWLACIWLYSLFWALPPLFGWSRYSTEGFGTTCSYDYLVDKPADRYFLMTVVIGDFFVPLIIICYCYIWIMIKFRYHQKQYGDLLSASKTNQRSSVSMKVSSSEYPTIDGDSRQFMTKPGLKTRFGNRFKSTEFKIARTVILVVVFFCISWTPYTIVCLIGQYGRRELISPVVAQLPVIVAKLGAIYNPIIYALTHPRFKMALKKIFPCCLGLSRKPRRHNCIRQPKQNNRVIKHYESDVINYAITVETLRGDAAKCKQNGNSEDVHVIKITGPRSEASPVVSSLSQDEKPVKSTTLSLGHNEAFVRWLKEAASQDPYGKVVVVFSNMFDEGTKV